MTDCHQLRVAFAGTPEFSVPALRSLIDSSHQLVAVLTQPDRPAGRGRKSRSSPIKQLALTHGLEVLQPESLRTKSAQQSLQALNLDVLVVVAYGLLLPEKVLSIPKLGCVNIHGSLLPRWRGAAPIHRAVLAGDEVTGVGIMLMDKGLDTGPLLASRSIAIDADATTATLHDKLADLGAITLMDVLAGWCLGDIKPVPQTDADATYAEKIKKSEAVIDWHQSALEIDRQVRAFNPWPVAQTSLEGESIRVWESYLVDQIEQTGEGADSSVPGTVLLSSRRGIEVATGSGVLGLKTIQLPGKRPVSTSDFANSRDITGHSLGSDTKLKS